MFDIHRRPIHLHIIIDRRYYFLHILVVAAFELYPDDTFFVIRRDEVPQIAGPMARLVLDEHFAHAFGRSRDHFFAWIALHELPMYCFDYICQRVGFAHHSNLL